MNQQVKCFLIFIYILILKDGLKVLASTDIFYMPCNDSVYFLTFCGYIALFNAYVCTSLITRFCFYLIVFSVVFMFQHTV